MPYADKAKNDACRRRWRESNRERQLEAQRRWNAAHKEHVKTWRKNNRDKVHASANRYNRNSIKTLKDEYIRSLLFRNGYGHLDIETMQPLVEVKRAIIKLEREMKCKT